MEEEKKEGKFSEFKKKVKLKFEDLRYKKDRCMEKVTVWANENPEQAGQAIIGLLGMVIAGGSKIAYDVSKKREKKKLDDENERETYDPRTGLYFYTKRAMTNREKLELSRRMKNGEMKADILYDMNLI